MSTIEQLPVESDRHAGQVLPGRSLPRRAIIDGIESAICSILVTDLFVEVSPEHMDPDDALRGQFGLDSLGFVELRVQCENRFGVVIADADFSPENFTSIRSVAALVRDLQARSEVSGT